MSAPTPDSGHSLARDTSDANLQRVHADLLVNKPQPKEGYSVLPLFLLGLLSTLVFVACIYFVHFRGGMSPLVYDERFDPAKAMAKGPASVDPVAAGKRLYNSAGACVTCHLPTGLGQPGVFPPLAKSEWVQGSEERLIRIVLHGLTGELKVEGATYNGMMPAFGAGGFNWSDERIAHVLTYVRQEWGNTGGAITPEKVTEVRTKSAAGRAKAWTQPELEALQ